MIPIKHLTIIIALALILGGCKRESYVSSFDKLPQERMAEQIELVKNTLLSAENGWIGTLATGSGGGYGFYMKFNEDETVDMSADLTENSSSTIQVSRYRIRQDMGAALTFDTYNYISLLNNPDPEEFGGEIRNGFRSDIDFIYDHSTEDSIIFIGKRYRQLFSFVKATNEQRTKYVGDGYLNAIIAFKEFFINNSNAYFELANGQKVSVEANSTNSLEAGKRITLSSIYEENDSVASTMGKFAYTVDGMHVLDNGINFAGVNFSNLKFIDANNMAIYDITGHEYVLKNSTVPLLPLYKLWGSKYNGMLSAFKQIYPGTSPSGADILNFFHNNLENAYTGYPFNSGRINIEWNVINKRVNLKGFSSQNGGSSGWTTTSVYNYEVDNQGVYTFTLRDAFSGGYVSKILQPLHEFLLNNKIKFDYYQYGTNLYAQMTSVNNPAISMTFVLY